MLLDLAADLQRNLHRLWRVHPVLHTLATVLVYTVAIAVPMLLTVGVWVLADAYLITLPGIVQFGFLVSMGVIYFALLGPFIIIAAEGTEKPWTYADELRAARVREAERTAHWNDAWIDDWGQHRL